MKAKMSKLMKIVQCILSILLAGAFLFFFIGEFFLPAENVMRAGDKVVFEAEWVRLLPDGTKEPYTVPGDCNALPGEPVIITTTLPENLENTTICIRSMQQELKIYVGDVLRKEYSTLDTQLVGKTSTMAYVFVDIYSSDAGQVLRIEAATDSHYSGYTGEILIGARSDIEHYFYGKYAPALLVAGMMFLIGLVVMVSGLWIHIVYKRKMELVYLGNAILIASTWLMVESKLRQFIFPNSTIAMQMGFLLTALFPYPFLTYINAIQKSRYEIAYFILGKCTILNFIVITVLQAFGIKDFYETLKWTHLLIFGLIAIMSTTIIRDIVKGYVKEYREVATGFAILMGGGICEIVLVYVTAAQLNGIFLSIGLIALLLMAGLKTIRDLLMVEKEKQMAIAATESKTRFLANMSHEIRTPINTIIGMNEMILRDNTDAVIEDYANHIKSASRMLIGLINDVLDFSKIEAGKLQIVENEYVLSDMLKDVISSSEMRAQQKGLQIELKMDETMPSILRGDEIRIKQILNNLLTNGIKYTEEGSIRLIATGTTNEKGFCLQLSVSDTGRGIKKEDMEKLFGSFQRFELTKNRYIEGTGLGLSITKQLVHIMNGSIDVQSEYGMGSCFTVCIPQVVVDNTPISIKDKQFDSERQAKKAKKSALQFPGSRILAVDDTITNLAVIQGLLKPSKIQVDVASGGYGCLQKTKENKYDLILMDHMMPEPDGIQTLHLIREDAGNLNIDTPIIVLTANAIEGVREYYLQEGFSDYLTKPVEAEKLEEMLMQYLKG